MADELHARQAFVSLDSDWIDANRAETRISAIIANVLPPMQMIPEEMRAYISREWDCVKE